MTYKGINSPFFSDTYRPLELLLIKIDPYQNDLIFTLENEKIQYNVRFLNNDDEIASLFQKHTNFDDLQPDFLVLDLSQPMKENAKLLARIKQTPSLQDIPLILLVRSEAQAEVFQRYGLHADAYIPKSLVSKQIVPGVASVA